MVCNAIFRCCVLDDGLPNDDDYYSENEIDRLLHAAQK